jgi:hypothetical protein
LQAAPQQRGNPAPNAPTPTTTPTLAIEHTNPTEQALLGALILQPSLIAEIRHALNPADLANPLHEDIYNAILHLADQAADATDATGEDQGSTPTPPALDPITLNAHLLNTHNRAYLYLQAGAATYLHTLTTACPIPANAPAYAKQVRDTANLRAINKTATRLHQIATTSTPDQLDQALAEALQTLDDVAANLYATGPQAKPAGLADLSWLHTGQPPEMPTPTILARADGHHLFYPGKVNGIFGDPESGKTWIAQAAIIETLHAGGNAAIIDVDHNGPELTTQRLLALGATPTQLADQTRFRYYQPEEPDELLEAVDQITEWAPDLLLVDSIGEMFPMLGVSTNDGDEMTTALRRTCTKPTTTGVCVITIDHLPKSTEARETGYAIGSIAKKRMIRGVYLRADARLQPAPDQIGKITLRIIKDTAGEVRRTSAGGYAGTFTLDSTQPGVTTWDIGREDAAIGSDGQFRPTHLMEAVSRYVEDYDQVSFREIKMAIRGKTTAVQDALRILISEGYISVIEGSRGTHKHHSVAQYREAEDANR